LSVAPEFWASPAAPRRTTAVAPLLAQWANEGWPVIVRRPTIDDPPDNVPVGMPLGETSAICMGAKKARNTNDMASMRKSLLAVSGNPSSWPSGS